ncbi:MAG: response regulator transcription factor [Prevotellaceae bacterium]|nr:response regulator transcription factor [Prevotellaceae bacterium]
MEQRRILIVDDEPDLCDILRFNLEAEGYATRTAHSAEEVLAGGLAADADLLLLDVMMGAMSGFDLARQLRSEPATARLPIIFLTARDTESDTLRGFRVGADDYVAKPFSVHEVLARIRAVLLRTSAAAETPAAEIVSHCSLQMDRLRRIATIDGCDIGLTRTEFELLWLLLTHRGSVFSRQELIDTVWRKDVVVTDRTVDVNIARLRKKLGIYAANIANRQGYGYYFEP